MPPRGAELGSGEGGGFAVGVRVWPLRWFLPWGAALTRLPGRGRHRPAGRGEPGLAPAPSSAPVVLCAVLKGAVPGRLFSVLLPGSRQNQIAAFPPAFDPGLS